VQLLGPLQFLPLLAQDELVDRLGDADEGNLPRDFDERQTDLLGRDPHRVGEAREIVRNRQTQCRHSAFGQSSHQVGQFLVLARPGDAGAEHQHAAVDPG